MSADHDPLLGSITAYVQTVECMACCYGGSARLEVDEWPGEGCVVKWSDLPALIARVRADERQQARQRVEALAPKRTITFDDGFGYSFTGADGVVRFGERPSTIMPLVSHSEAAAAAAGGDA